jgi:phage-related protein
MANLEELVVKLRLESSQMKSELESVKGQMAGLGGGMSTATGATKGLSGAMGGLMKSLLPIMAATAVIGFLKDSAKAAAEDNESQALLARQLEATTGATKAQIASVEEQIGSLEMMSGVADDKIRPAFAGLVRATGDTTKAMQLQKLALDVSAATGKDVSAVSHAMAKAINGNDAALTRMIPALKGNKDQMGYLIKNFDGAAKKAADTNPYKKLGVAMDHIKEGVGRGLLPIMNVLAGIMVKIAPIFDMVGAVLEKLLDPVMKLVGMIMDVLMPPLNDLMDIFMELVDQIMPPLNDFIQSILVPILGILGDALKFLMPIIKVIAGIIGKNLTISIKVVTAILKPFITIIKNVWNALAPLRKQLQVVWNVIGQVAKQIQDKLMKAFKAIWAFIQKFIIPIWNSLMKAMKPIVDFIWNGMVKAFKGLLDFLKPVWAFFKPMIDGISKLLNIKIDMKAAMKVDDAEVTKAVATVATVKASGSVGSFGGYNGGGTGGGNGGGKKKKAKNVTNINTKVTAKTDAKPQDIAANIVNAVKFNLPVAMVGGSGVIANSTGSQFTPGFSGMGA